MTIKNMTAPLAEACSYACRNIPLGKIPVHRAGGTPAVFLLLMAYFMMWPATPSAASEVERILEAVRNADRIRQPLKSSEAMRGAWAALGMMASGEGRNAKGASKESLRAAEKAYEQAEERYRQYGYPLWLAYSQAPDEQQKAMALQRYERHGLPLEQARREAKEEWERLRFGEAGGDMDRNLSDFADAVDIEVAKGNITAGAAALLEMAYFNLEMFFARGRAEGTGDFRVLDAVRADLAGQIMDLSRASIDGVPLRGGVEAAVSAIAGDLMTMYGITGGAPYAERTSSGEERILDVSIFAERIGATGQWTETGEELSEEAREVMLRKYCDEAARIVVELTETPRIR